MKDLIRISDYFDRYNPRYFDEPLSEPVMFGCIIEFEQYAAIRDLAEASEATINEIARQAIDAYIIAQSKRRGRSKGKDNQYAGKERRR